MSWFNGNTRFNPTLDGNLSLGHAYLCMVNMTEARSAGGKFIVRMDDNQGYWLWKLGGKKKVHDCGLQMLDDLAWLGIVPDEVHWESEAEPLARAWVADVQHKEIGEPEFLHDVLPVVIGSRVTPYPYAPVLTKLKVVMDFMEGCGLIVRGYDLLDEFSLYCYFCEEYRIPIPHHVLVPRLDFPGQEQVSKTNNNLPISGFKKDKVDPLDVINALRASCLFDPGDAWTVNNIIDKPVWLGLA